MEILDNIDKNFKAKGPIKLWIWPIDTLPAGTLFKVHDIRLSDGERRQVSLTFKLSKDNDIDSLNAMLREKIVEHTEKQYDRKARVYTKMVKIWEKTPEIFTQQTKSYSTDTYTCSIVDMFSRDDYNVLATGCGSDTYHSKKHYEDALLNWESDKKAEIDKVRKKSYKKEILGACTILNAKAVPIIFELDIHNLEKTFIPGKKPKFPVEFEANMLNLLMNETGGDIDFNDEFFDNITDDFEEEDYELLSKLRGWTVGAETEGYHHHDGQVCEYTVTFYSPEGWEYKLYNDHCLVTGWNFHGTQIPE